MKSYIHFSILTLALAGLSSVARAQYNWAEVGVLSPTATMVTNTICWSDGKYLACDGNAPAPTSMALDDLTDASANHTSSYTIYIGDGAGANSTGINNIGIGYNSLNTLTGGAQNLAIGRGALYSLDGKSSNIAIGYQALISNVGNYNTAIGVNSMLNSGNDSNSNIAVGTDAGRGRNGNTHVGDSNVFLGYSTGSDLVNDASRNIFIGADTGDLTTEGDDNILIGYDIEPSSATASNELNIGNTVFGNTSTGYVGIGNVTTTNLTAELEVGGVVSATAFVGDGASLTNVPMSGGIDELDDAYHDAVTDNNLVLGHNGGNLDSNSEFNVAVGENALDGSLTGSDNNTAIGYGALSSNMTTADNNTALGYTALYSLSSGDSNVAIGSAAMYENTNGQLNVGIGRSTLGDNTTGHYNTAVGANSLRYNSTGENNTVLGYQAALGVSTYSITNSVVIGYRAGYVLEDAENNILIGMRAGDNITSGDDNIIIGHLSEAPFPTASNRLVIGNLIYGTDIDGTNTTLSSGNIGIGTMTPTTKLEVGGVVSATAFVGDGASLTNVPMSGGIDDLDDAYYDTSSTYNMFLGHSGSNLGSGSNQNLGIGNGVLNKALVSSNYNIGIGYLALEDLTGGSANVAVGVRALGNLSGASHNIAIGERALNALTSSGLNIAIGYYAGANLDEDGGDNALGNVVMGWRAGRYNQGGDYNVYLGYEAGYGHNSDTIGSRRNIGIGYHAGYAITTGDENVFIGHDAGANVTTGSGNILLGYNIDATSSTTSNELNIGNTIYGDLSNDYVGIGNSSPAYPLDVSGSIVASAGFRNGTNDFPRVKYWADAADYPAIEFDGNDGIQYFQTNDVMGLIAGGSTRLRIDPYGITSTVLLEATSGITVTGIVTATYFEGDGSRLTGVSGASSINELSDGYKDGASEYNLVLGHDGSNIDADSEYNIAIGETALDGASITGADYNVAIGVGALTNTNLSGDRNIAVGYNTLAQNTSGGNNISIGINSLYTNSTGTENTAVGDTSLNKNTTGDYNTAVGSNALLQNTVGDYNTAVGRFSLSENTTGGNNSALGQGALRYNETGSNNVALGYEAGFGVSGNSTISRSVIIGYRSGEALTTAENNIFVGYRSGDLTTTGDNNIIIGYDVDPSSATASNELNIGDTIYGDLSSGYIGIGQQTPSAQLEVSGTISATSVVAQGPHATTIQLIDGDGSNLGRLYNNFGHGQLEVADGNAIVNVLLSANGAVNQFISRDITFGATTAPTAEVDVYGTVSATAVSITGIVTATYFEGDGSRLTGVSGASSIDGLSDGYHDDTTNYNIVLGHSGSNVDGSSQFNVSLGSTAFTGGSLAGAVANVAIGHHALSTITIADDNTAVGYAALSQTTTGDDNTAIGYEALVANVDGSENTAVGKRALYSNTSGTQNVAVGRSALYNNNDGLTNTAVGYAALAQNTSGDSNVGVGFRSLNTNSTGNYNTALGVNALYSNTTNDNTAIGYQAMYANTSGTGNTAVGMEALQANTTGTENIVVGMRAMYANTTGSYNAVQGRAAAYDLLAGDNNVVMGNTAYANTEYGSNNVAIGRYAAYGAGGTNTISNTVALGYRSGYSLGNSENNILIGYQAGDVITTGSSNIIIGYDVDPSSATASNELNIGDTIYGDLASGYVGIGQQTPSAELEVAGTVSATGVAVTTDGTNYGLLTLKSELADGEYVGLRMGDLTYQKGGIFFEETGSYGRGRIHFAIDNIANPNLANSGDVHMTILGSGNVGIGEIAPTAKLEVAGDISSTAIDVTGIVTATYFEGDGSRLSNITASQATALVNGTSSVTVASNGSITIDTAGSTVMTIGDTGSIGIGTDTPASIFHFYENSAATQSDSGITIEQDGTGDPLLQFLLTGDQRWVAGIDNSDGNKFKIASSLGLDSNALITIDPTYGYVGIATTTPTSVLSVYENSAATQSGAGITIEQDGTGDSLLQFILTGDQRWVAGIDNSDGNKFKIASSMGLEDDVHVTVNTDGTVGIGTTTPTTELEVAGTISATAISITGVVTATYFEGDGSRLTNVGGASDIDSLTDAVNETSTEFNIILGHAGSNIDANSEYNIAVGLTALDDADMADADYNIAIGYDSMTNIETGDFNIGIGYAALKKVTTGERNSSIGYASMFENTTGSFNNAWGYNSLKTNTTGSYNMAIGYGALESATVANSNVAIGYNTFNTNTTGEGNVAIGYRAGYGVAATTIASNSVFIGYQAGDGITTAENNTFIGYQAGDNVTTGDNNIIIGYDINASSSTASNELVIGNLIFGTSIDGTANTISTGNIGIGVADPNAKLEVAGTVSATAFVGDGSGLTGVGGSSALNDIDEVIYSATDRHLFIGAASGGSLGTTPQDNYAIGDNALSSLTTGDRNIAIGTGALSDTTIQSSNIAIGDLALRDNTGHANIAIGREALRQNGANGNSVAIGQYALRLNTGAPNTAIGTYALQANTSGAKLVAIGYGAMDDNTTGDNNTAIGYTSGYYNKVGESNVFVGMNAGYGVVNTSVITGSVIIGYSAGYALTTADNNIIIGLQAADNLTTGDNNIIIGHDIDSPSATASNQLVIGNLIYGTSIDGTGTTVSSGNIGIGTSSPDEGRLEVKGGTVCVDTNNDDTASSCITTESDIRLKKNVKTLDNALDKIQKIRGVEFDWRWDEYDTIKRYKVRPHDVGVIAQEVEPVIPEAMDEEVDGFKTVNYDRLVPVLIEAVKELKSENDALKARLEALENK